MVGREGFEPSKAEGRQIYSLLRLTASLPPPRTPNPAPCFLVVTLLGIESARRSPLPACTGIPFRVNGFRRALWRLELAEGIEPPTR